MPVVVIEHAAFPPAPIRTPVDIKNNQWRVAGNDPWGIWFSHLPGNISASISAESTTLVSGTLSPDEKPVGLTPADANKVLFYSTDKDHLLRWTGTAWQVIDYDAGAISFFIVAPTSNGWVLCNGVGTASMTLPNGSLTSVSVPDMVGSYPKGGTSYSGATPTAANAPGLSGTPGGTVTPFTPTGSVSSITPTGTVTGSLPEHFHEVNGLTGDNSDSVTVMPAEEAGIVVADDPHYHSFEEDTELTGGQPIDDLVFTGDPDTPTFTGDLASPGFTGAIGSLAVDATGQPKHTTLLPYLRL